MKPCNACGAALENNATTCPQCDANTERVDLPLEQPDDCPSPQWTRRDELMELIVSLAIPAASGGAGYILFSWVGLLVGLLAGLFLVQFAVAGGGG